MKKLFITLAVVAAACSANAQLLWKVTAPGSSTPSYIVGTHHVAPAGMIDSIAGLRDAVASVGSVYGEVEMSNAQSPEMQQKIMGMLMAPADSTLNKVLTKEEYDSVGTIVNKYFNGMATVDQFAMMKPIALSTQIALLQSMLAFPGFNPAEQFDAQVQALAKSLGKTTSGLETLEFQMNMLYGTPVAEQAKDLMKAVRHDDRAIEQTKALSAAYLARDLDKMQQIVLDPEMGMDESSAKELIYDRNANWAVQLEKIIPQAPVLVAVGAGHLPGDKGLLALLRNAGFTVTPVDK